MNDGLVEAEADVEADDIEPCMSWCPVEMSERNVYLLLTPGNDRSRQSTEKRESGARERVGFSCSMSIALISSFCARKHYYYLVDLIYNTLIYKLILVLLKHCKALFPCNLPSYS